MFDLAEEASNVAESVLIDWAKLDGQILLITGITGLIGSSCARVVLEHNRNGGKVHLLGLVRDVRRAKDVLSGYDEEDGLHLVEGSLQDVPAESLKSDYTIHAACPTASDFFIEHPVQTADAIVLGTRRLLEAAKEHGSKGFVYVSSMEVYGKGNSCPGLQDLLDESDVGHVDPMSIRSCYPEGKRMAEQYCASFAGEFGLRASVARLSQTIGPGIQKDDGRLFAKCAMSAIKDDDIVLRTTGESSRMYVYTMDAVSAIFKVLLNGAPGRAYNVANPVTYSTVRDMAAMVANMIPGSHVQVRYEIDENAPFPPEHHLPLDVSALTELGWGPTKDLKGMFQNLIAYLSD